MTEATVVCAWCGVVMGTKDVEVPDGAPAETHGICGDCDAKVRSETKEPKPGARRRVLMRMTCDGELGDGLRTRVDVLADLYEINLTGLVNLSWSEGHRLPPDATGQQRADAVRHIGISLKDLAAIVAAAKEV